MVRVRIQFNKKIKSKFKEIKPNFRWMKFGEKRNREPRRPKFRYFKKRKNQISYFNDFINKKIKSFYAEDEVKFVKFANRNALKSEISPLNHFYELFVFFKFGLKWLNLVKFAHLNRFNRFWSVKNGS